MLLNIFGTYIMPPLIIIFLTLSIIMGTIIEMVSDMLNYITCGKYYDEREGDESPVKNEDTWIQNILIMLFATINNVGIPEAYASLLFQETKYFQKHFNIRSINTQLLLLATVFMAEQEYSEDILRMKEYAHAQYFVPESSFTFVGNLLLIYFQNMKYRNRLEKLLDVKLAGNLELAEKYVKSFVGSEYKAWKYVERDINWNPMILQRKFPFVDTTSIVMLYTPFSLFLSYHLAIPLSDKNKWLYDLNFGYKHPLHYFLPSRIQSMEYPIRGIKKIMLFIERNTCHYKPIEKLISFYFKMCPQYFTYIAPRLERNNVLMKNTSNCPFNFENIKRWGKTFDGMKYYRPIIGEGQIYNEQFMKSLLPHITGEEIHELEKTQDLIYYKDYILDVTFLLKNDKHPGGKNSLSNYINRHVSEETIKMHHSENAQIIMFNYCIGYVR